MVGFFFFFDVVDKGVEFVESFFYDLIIFEGSGVMFLVYRIDVYIFIIGGRQKMDFLWGYFGFFRIVLVDLIIVIMLDEINFEKRVEIRKIVEEINLKVDFYFMVFCLRFLGNILGKKFGFVMIFQSVLFKVREYFEGFGVEVVVILGNFLNRLKLREDLEKFRGIDVVVVEFKVVVVDVVIKWVLERGIEVIYFDNELVNIDGKDLRKLVLEFGKRVLGRRV